MRVSLVTLAWVWQWTRAKMTRSAFERVFMMQKLIRIRHNYFARIHFLITFVPSKSLLMKTDYPRLTRVQDSKKRHQEGRLLKIFRTPNNMTLLCFS